MTPRFSRTIDLDNGTTRSGRQMGSDAERLLSDQIRQLEDGLAQLGDDRAAAKEDEQEDRRLDLTDRGARRENRLDELAAIRDALALHLSEASA